MIRPFYFLSALLMCCVLVSCDEDKQETTDVAFFVTPKVSETPVIESGETQRYEMELHTTHDYINHIRISSFNKVEGNKVKVDTMLSRRTDKFIFDYVGPYLNRDSVIVELTFEAWDNEGSYGTSQRTLILKSRKLLADELTGIVLRSSASGHPDAFAFAAASKTFNWKNSPDSIRADIYLEANDDFSSLSFRSKTKAKMLRFNQFDYATANSLGLQTVYGNSGLSDRIDVLKTNDIILVGHDNQAEGVLLITNIVRTGDQSERCVQISFKGVQ